MSKKRSYRDDYGYTDPYHYRPQQQYQHSHAPNPHKRQKQHNEHRNGNSQNGRHDSPNPNQTPVRPTAQPNQTLADLNTRHASTISIPGIPHALQELYSGSIYPPPLPPLAPHLSSAPFRHSSEADHRVGELNYERLEFLGDAYLEIIATRLIYSRFAELPVGRQSLLREKLVRNSTLAQYAKAYGFDKMIRGVGLDKQSEKNAEKILGDIVEAYLGALIISEVPPSAADHTPYQERDGSVMTLEQDATEPVGGFAIAEAWLTALWLPILLSEDPNIAVVTNRKEDLVRFIGNSKFVKFEYLETKPMTLTPDKSTQQYTIGVYMTGWGYEKELLGQAVGVSKKEAGMRAAGAALDHWPDMAKVREVKLKADEERRIARELAQANAEEESAANGEQKADPALEDGEVADGNAKEKKPVKSKEGTSMASFIEQEAAKQASA